MMHFLKSIPLLTVLAIVAKCSTNGQEKRLSAKDAGSSSTESNLLVYFLDQLYVMKSKVQQLEKGEKEMNLALKSCERRIKVVENRKETRCKYMYTIYSIRNSLSSLKFRSLVIKRFTFLLSGSIFTYTL